MRVLIACEESQAVCKEFRKLGHEAFSCDILPCSGGHPEWHIQDDIIRVLEQHRGCMEKGGVQFFYNWDLMIAHPPCQHIAVSGARWFKQKIADGRQLKAVEFFMKLWNSKIPRIAIENPVNIIPTRMCLPASQFIQPWQFGHGETKKTGLWLFNLPKLKPTNIVEGRESRIHKLPPTKDRAKLRSKTYPGIAKAMAKQWGLDVSTAGEVQK